MDHPPFNPLGDAGDTQPPSLVPGAEAPSCGGLPEAPLVDLDSKAGLGLAVVVAQKEILQLRSQCQMLQDTNLELRKVLDLYEGLMEQMIEKAQNREEREEAEIQKDQLSSKGKSSDLSRSFKKLEAAIEGHLMREETMKKCTEDYFLMAKKLGQQYQALKTHVELKFWLVKEEIALVQSKAQAEALAFQVRLWKVQLQKESLENALKQKTKENDELVRICKDLIFKLEKM